MIKKLNESESLKFKRISPEEKEQKGILGRLYGPVASCVVPTRNGRKYSEQLWEKVFQNDIVQELFANGGLAGELQHPVEREETDPEKIAIIMPEPPVKDKDGHLVGYVDIVDTPCGRIAYQLAKYGFNFGISSRGTGDLISGVDGEEVDPDTYQLNAFDLVAVPALKDARLSFTEALDTKKYNKTLKQALNEELNKASDEDKKIMNETLDNLNITLNESEYTKDELIDKFGTDDLDLINAGNEEDVKLKEKLVDPSEEDLAGIEDAFAELGLEIEGKGKTTFGNLHYQLRKELDHDVTRDDLGPIFDTLCDLSTDDMPTVCNVGVHRDGPNVVSASLDVLKKNVDDIDEQFYLHSDKDEAARQSLRYNIDPDKLVTDLLSLSGHKELEELCRKYNITVDVHGKEKLGVNILSPNETKQQQGVDESVSNNGCSNIEAQVINEDAVNDRDDLVKELQEALMKSKELEKDNLSLQEKLSVCNAKEKSLQEELKKYKTSTANLSDVAKDVKDLRESIKKKDSVIKSSGSRINNLIESKKSIKEELNRVLSSYDELEKDVKVLNEKLSSKDAKLSEYETTLVKNRKALRESKERYITAKAVAYGISDDEVKSNLNESYSFKDIDSICEELSERKKNMSKLPFRITEDTRISLKTKKDPILRGIENDDDDVSDTLLTFLR